MSTLTITRGLPSSGKSTWAHGVRDADPDGTIVVNRDDTRERLFGSCDQDYYACEKEVLFRKEKMVTQANHAAISEALKMGLDVIVDDTNLPVRRCRELRALAVRAGANFQVQDFSLVSLEQALEWNQRRERQVPEHVIRGMYDRYIRGGLAPIPDEPEQGVLEPVVRNESLPKAYIVDMDGTLALMRGRSPYDESRVHEDLVNDDVAETVFMLAIKNGIHLIVMSARTEACRYATQQWLYDNRVLYDELYMRTVGDMRRDREVKYDLFNEHVRGKYDVLGVFDDRDQVVAMWRELGLTCFQVAPGDF